MRHTVCPSSTHIQNDEKQETVSVHQALNKEFLVDDTAIATHQISNKLDQLEKLVKKGESKSGHTLGEQTSN